MEYNVKNIWVDIGFLIGTYYAFGFLLNSFLLSSGWGPYREESSIETFIGGVWVWPLVVVITLINLAENILGWLEERINNGRS